MCWHQSKWKNWTTTGKEGERENPEGRGREVLALPGKVSAPDLNTQVTFLRGTQCLSSQASRNGQDGHTQTCPSEHVRSRGLPGHLSWGRAHGLEMWPILLAELKKSVVENTKNGPLPILGGKNIQNPPETETEQNENNLLPPKENHTGNQCPARSPHVYVLTRLVEVILFWIPQ